MKTTLSAEQFVEKIEDLVEAYQQSVAREAGLDHLEELAEGWDIDEYVALLTSLQKRGFSRQAVGQVVLLLLEAAVGEGYIKPQLTIVKDILNENGTKDHEEEESVTAGVMGSSPKDAPYYYFHDDGNANIYVGQYRLPDGWRIEGTVFTANQEENAES